MSTLFPKTISFSRRSGGSYVRGDWIPGAPTTLTFQGSVQPISGKEVEALPVGREDLGKVKIYSSTPLLVSTEGGDTAGDVVEWQGQKWEVIGEMKNQNDLIPHYKYYGQFVEEITP